jgi:hypothetical protein
LVFLFSLFFRILFFAYFLKMLLFIVIRSESSITRLLVHLSIIFTFLLKTASVELVLSTYEDKVMTLVIYLLFLCCLRKLLLWLFNRMTHGPFCWFIYVLQKVLCLCCFLRWDLPNNVASLWCSWYDWKALNE